MITTIENSSLIRRMVLLQRLDELGWVWSSAEDLLEQKRRWILATMGLDLKMRLKNAKRNPTSAHFLPFSLSNGSASNWLCHIKLADALATK